MDFGAGAPVAPDTYRNFLVFDLSSVDGPVVGAALQLFLPTGSYLSPDGSETFVVYDVSTSIAGPASQAVFGASQDVPLSGTKLVLQVEVVPGRSLALRQRAQSVRVAAIPRHRWLLRCSPGRRPSVVARIHNDHGNLGHPLVRHAAIHDVYGQRLAVR